MRKIALGSAALASATSALALAACASLAAESLAGSGADASIPSTDGSGTFADAGTAVIEANAIVLVHAAAFPAFRICFEGAVGERPLPTTDLMPESNVVGVDVGTAVRLPARSGTLGRAFVFPELALRALYPAFGGETAGPTCGTLLGAVGTKSLATAVGEINVDLSRGVHALVLLGCQPAGIDPSASVERCGADWDFTLGNLQLVPITLTAFARPSEDRLTLQIVQLSPALQARATGRAFGVAFGSLDGGATPTPLLEGAVAFGRAVPDPPASVAYAGSDPSSFATSGVFVTLGGALDDGGTVIDAGDDAGPREVVVVQSLADIQRRSSSRALPADWFAIASSYVLLTVGDPDPRLADGGVDVDPRRALHLLAVPLATPDAGAADAGP